MAKFDIPRFKYLFQDEDGDIWFSMKIPHPENYGDWMGGGLYSHAEHGKGNADWRDTLIDLDKDDYEFEDGILRRIEK